MNKQASGHPFDNRVADPFHVYGTHSGRIVTKLKPIPVPGEPRVVFTGEGLQALEDLSPELRKQVLEATARFDTTQLVATLPIAVDGSKHVIVTGVAEAGTNKKWTVVLPSEVTLYRGDVLEIRVKRRAAK